MLRVAVTGGIACGKSCLAEYLKARDTAVCDADELAHGILVDSDAVRERIQREFGSDIIDCDGRVDRKRLGDIVFLDRGRLAVLNAIVHPAVKARLKKWLMERESEGALMAVAVVPLLFEASMDSGWDAIVCVVSAEEIQLQRLLGRGLSPEQCRARINAQLPLREKAGRSDYVIENNGSLPEFEKKIDDVFREIQEIT
jgi:dephospho-CoA kinase